MSGHALLDSRTHAEVRVRAQPSAALGDAVMSCVTVPTEFRQVQAHFPILFHRNIETDAFHAVALFGFEDGENLFLDGESWDAGYRPLAQAIQPFLIGRPADGEGPGQVHIDMNHARVAAGGAQGEALFDEDGQPTAFVEDIAGKLGALDEGYRASAGFFAALKRHELLEPFTLELTLAEGKRSLVGFHIIDEAKLRALDGEALGELHGAGHLMPIFMALASLSNLNDLAARRNARGGNG